MCFPDFEETGVDTSNRLQCPSLSVQPAVAIVTETTRHGTSRLTSCEIIRFRLSTFLHLIIGLLGRKYDL